MNRNQYRAKSTILRIPVVAGSFAIVDLPRANDAESIQFRLTGTVNVTTAGTAVRAEAPTQLIQRIDITANGRDQIVSMPYWSSVFGALDRKDKQANGARMSTPPSSAAIASYPIEALGAYDFCLPDGERAKDSNLPTFNMSLFQLRVTFGNVADLFTGSAQGTLTNCFLEVTYTEMVEIPDADGARSMPYFLKKVSFQEYAPGGNNANYEVKIPAGNLIKSILVRSAGNVTVGEPSATVINNVIARAALDVRLNITGASLRGENNMAYGAVFTGYYFHDFSRAANNAARMTELWNVTNQTEPKVVFDVMANANTLLSVVTTEMIRLQ